MQMKFCEDQMSSSKDIKIDSAKAVVLRIQELSAEKGMKPYTLALKADIPRATLESILNKGVSPTITSIGRICRGFDITLREFFDSEYFDICEENEE